MGNEGKKAHRHRGIEAEREEMRDTERDPRERPAENETKTESRSESLERQRARGECVQAQGTERERERDRGASQAPCALTKRPASGQVRDSFLSEDLLRLLSSGSRTTSIHDLNKSRQRVSTAQS